MADSGRVVGVRALLHCEFPACFIPSTVTERLDRIARAVSQLAVVVLRRDTSVDEISGGPDRLFAPLCQETVDDDTGDPGLAIDLECSEM